MHKIAVKVKAPQLTPDEITEMERGHALIQERRRQEAQLKQLFQNYQWPNNLEAVEVHTEQNRDGFAVVPLFGNNGQTRSDNAQALYDIYARGKNKNALNNYLAPHGFKISPKTSGPANDPGRWFFNVIDIDQEENTNPTKKDEWVLAMLDGACEALGEEGFSHDEWKKNVNMVKKWYAQSADDAAVAKQMVDWAVRQTGDWDSTPAQQARLVQRLTPKVTRGRRVIG